MTSTLTFAEFARLMREFEHNCTEEEIHHAWAVFCRDQNERKANT